MADREKFEAFADYEPYAHDLPCVTIKSKVYLDALEVLKEQETVEHACEILRSNGWTETEPICSECDAIHVVRCKDCNKRNTSDCPLHYGGHSENDTDDDWFCADGGKGAEK